MRSEERGRLVVIDVVRGVAIVGVVLFHLVWDLDLYGYLPFGLSSHPLWIAFGRTLAATFMALVGVSLVLAFRQGFRSRPFARRLAVIGLAAAGVTAATYVAFPGAFVYFGILHAIFVASLLGALVLRLDAATLAQLGVFVLLFGLMGSFEAFDTRWLAWIGFSSNVPPSNDFVPVFPWFGLTLMGMAAAKHGSNRGWDERLRRLSIGRATRVMSWAGRKSLVIYLVHQPAMLGALELLRRLGG